MTRGLARVAAGVAAVTAAARAVGLLRTAVFAAAVGATEVGDVYTLLNAAPTVVYEALAGGALAAVVVPLVAGHLALGRDADADRTTSVLLTRTTTALLALAVVGYVAAEPLAGVLLGSTAEPGARALGASMLRVFVWQLPLYGVLGVLAGTLQARHRFVAAALAPLLSSVVVGASYLLFAGWDGADTPAALTRRGELTLSLGTTLGVAVLAATVLVPAVAAQRLRPAWRFVPGDGRRARDLAGAGLLAVGAQQVAVLVGLRLAADGPVGSVVVVSLATVAFLVPWSVLALPVATSAFPRLVEAGPGERDQVLREATRAALVAGAAGAVVLLVCARPVALLLLDGDLQQDALTRAVLAHAAAVPAYAVVAVRGRALLAAGRPVAAAAGTTAGWLLAAGGAALLVTALDVAPGTAVGLAVSGGLLVGAVLHGVLLRGQARS